VRIEPFGKKRGSALVVNRIVIDYGVRH
jgi:hypothetical protein